MEETYDAPELEREDNTGWVDTTDEADPQVELASSAHVSSWNRLVSTTNWEKGRIICAWRDELVALGAPDTAYSDEAWSRRVGGVSPQHVGRLRRVFARFHDVQDQYKGLYWSHFQAALDWDDAEMWLEGALQNDWSVAAMRTKRIDTLGLSEVPRSSEEDALAVEGDEDVQTPEGLPEVLYDSAAAVVQETEDSQDREAPEDRAAAPLGGVADEEAVVGSVTKTDPVRPFEDLPELPDDLAEAVEALKLAIVRHKLAGWSEVRRQDVLGAIEALGQLVLAPSDEP